MSALTSASNTNSPVRCVGAWTRCEHEQPKALRAVRGPVGRWARGRMGADSCPSVQERSTCRCLGAARGTWLHFQRSEAISTFSGVPKRFCFRVLKRWFSQRSGATHSPPQKGQSSSKTFLSASNIVGGRVDPSHGVWQLGPSLFSI